MTDARKESIQEDAEVVNQPPPLEDYNAFLADPALREALSREGGGWAAARAEAMGAEVGSARLMELARQANRYPPELRTHDRFGGRIDEIDFHPAWHELMRLGIESGMHSLSWTATERGAQAARAALYYLFNQGENGVACPVTMTYASIPVLRVQPEIARDWEGRVLSTRYDRRSLPAASKDGATIGMAMTEKQGGSDLRARRGIRADGP